MRVLISADVEGGVWSYAVSLATELVADGCEVLLAVIGDPTPQRLRELPDEVAVAARSFRLEWMPDPWQDVELAGEWLASTARSWGADIVHLNQLTYSANDFGAPTLVAVHSDVRSWFRTTMGCPAPMPEWREYDKRVSEGLRAADALVTVSRWQADLVLSEYGVTVDRVIYNGLGKEDFRPTPVPGREPSILTVGRAWDRAKGIGVLDDALGLLGDQAPKATLAGSLSGPGGERFSPRHLQSVGPVDRAEISRFFGRASIYVAPAFYEPFGLAPLEAVAGGCSLILSDIPSFRELWDECALFFPPGDTDRLARCISRLIEDPDSARTFAVRARQRGMTRYTSHRFADEYRALYQDLAGKTALQTVP